VRRGAGGEVARTRRVVVLLGSGLSCSRRGDWVASFDVGHVSHE